MSRANPRFRRINPTLNFPVNDIYRMRIRGEIESQLTISTFYFRGPGAAVSETLAKQTDIATTVVAIGNFVSFYAACCSSDWSATDVLVDCPFLKTLATVQESASTYVGTGPAGHEPTPIAAIIHRQTAVKGQCGRGHVSIPAVPTAWVTKSELNTLINYNALGLLMHSQLTGSLGAYTPVLYSLGTRISKSPGVSDVVSCTTRALLGTVRRRLIGRGK
jgi:hypothetical protein